MTPPTLSPRFDPIGIVLAVVFVASLALLFWWMFRVPRPVPHKVAAVRRSVGALQRIVVPVSGRTVSERAVELACRLGEAQKAEIILTYVIEVPFTLALSTRVPSEEAKGEQALGTARFIVEQHGLPVRTRMFPHRYAWAGILHVSQEEQADAIVMAAGAGHPGPQEVLGRTAVEVIRRATCEVIVDKPTRRGR